MQNLAANHKLLQVPTRQRTRRICRTGGTHIKGFDNLFGKGPRLAPVQHPAAVQLFACGGGQHRIFSQRHIGGGGMAQPLFGGAKDAHCAAGRWPQQANLLAVKLDHAGCGQHLAR